MANLGYIGLGAMGGRIADRLISKGHTGAIANQFLIAARGSGSKTAPCFSTCWPGFQESPHDVRHEDGD